MKNTKLPDLALTFHSLFRLIPLYLALALSFSVQSQQGKGLPEWVFSSQCGAGLQFIDWRPSPPEFGTIPGTGPTLNAPAVPAVNHCGEPLFIVAHSGIPNSPTDVFFYDMDGNPLLDDESSNGPGLNGKLGGIEMQVIQVPGKAYEWYIIYPEWEPDNGAPLNNGAYIPAPKLYSRVKYTCGQITVLERDLPLSANGTVYTYTNAMAISRPPGGGSDLCLYITRRSSASYYLSVDRFIISSDSISFDKNTGQIEAPYWNLTIDCSAIEVSNDYQRLLIINRNQSYGWIGLILFDTQEFNTLPENCQLIYFDDLILQPDYNVLSSPGSIYDISNNNPALYFLQNLQRKTTDIEFSPDGNYLYFVNGGFVEGYYTNITYLGQIKIGPPSNPETYPYEVRLQIQTPPEGIYDPYTGRGGLESSYVGMSPAISHIEQAYDGKIYFTKRDHPKLYVIPEPDEDMPQMLIPGDVDLSVSGAPNIDFNCPPYMISDQIDGYDYQVSTNPVISLGNDTMICAGETLALTPGDKFESYCWQDGSADPVYYAGETGTYWVEVIDEYGCIDHDTIELTITGTPVSLGNDTIICQGDILTLDPGNSYLSYLWQDGSSNSTYSASNSGLYWIEVTDASGCTFRDSIEVSTSTASVFLGEDRDLCTGDTLVLDPGTGYISYLWQDGSTGSDYLVTSTGLYWVEILLGGCSARDSVMIAFSPYPQIDLGADQVICEGDFITLDAGAGFEHYQWQNGSPDRFFTTDTSGLYWVDVSNSAGCATRDSILITVALPPEVYLGQDTILESGQTITLDAGSSFNSYLWQDGSTGQFYNVSGQGAYWVIVTNDYCSAADTILVEIDDCEAKLFIPNCFTPNGDGHNERFNPVSQNLDTFNMLIFNRWGQLLFETSDLNEGWDGKVNGQLCPIGTYFYLIRYTTHCDYGLDKNGESKGSVTLLE